MGKFAEIKREEEELNLENELVDEPTDDISVFIISSNCLYCFCYFYY